MNIQKPFRNGSHYTIPTRIYNDPRFPTMETYNEFNFYSGLISGVTYEFQGNREIIYKNERKYGMVGEDRSSDCPSGWAFSFKRFGRSSKKEFCMPSSARAKIYQTEVKEDGTVHLLWGVTEPISGSFESKLYYARYIPETGRWIRSVLATDNSIESTNFKAKMYVDEFTATAFYVDFRDNLFSRTRR